MDIVDNINKKLYNTNTGTDMCAAWTNKMLGRGHHGNAWDNDDLLLWNGLGNLRPLNGDYKGVYMQAQSNLRKLIGNDFNKLDKNKMYLGHVGIHDSSYNKTAWSKGLSGKTASHIVRIRYDRGAGRWVYDHNINYRNGAHGGAEIDRRHGDNQHTNQGAQVYTGNLTELFDGTHPGMLLVSIGYKLGGRINKFAPGGSAPEINKNPNLVYSYDSETGGYNSHPKSMSQEDAIKIASAVKNKAMNMGLSDLMARKIGQMAFEEGREFTADEIAKFAGGTSPSTSVSEDTEQLVTPSYTKLSTFNYSQPVYLQQPTTFNYTQPVYLLLQQQTQQVQLQQPLNQQVVEHLKSSNTYSNPSNSSHTIKIDKKNKTLSVGNYVFPISISKNGLAPKKKEGDGLTPEGTFKITQRKDYTNKIYNDDVYGKRKPYGHWFFSLSCGHGVGIHGSDQYNKPGKGGTHGCIALNTKDVETLNNYMELNGGYGAFSVSIS